ncbi:MAG: hypothetical protein FWH21_06845 [Kiritimatiellaeota bacterium]|nr:hypothetical protein [Kiritimatiellota bacterium]
MRRKFERCADFNGRAAISADIAASTSLTQEQRVFLDEKLRELLRHLRTLFGVRNFFGRLVKGDCLECVLEESRFALRVALLIRTFVKSQDIKSPDSNFNNYGVRVAVGIGTITTLDRKRDFISGDAIVLSGRAVQELSNRAKSGLAFRSANEDWNNVMAPLFALIDTMLVKNTKKQCGILWHCLSGKTEKEICAVTGHSQPTINSHTRAAGWAAIKGAVDYFEREMK